jgi:DNA-binding transcriptional MerR regulator
MADYRVDDLARMAGTTVRNVRHYQDTGLLPPPRRAGRVALYSDDHLSRLKLILGLLERGYTAANITELVGAWERGRDLSDVLGLERALSYVGAQEPPTYLSGAELCAAFGASDVETGLIEKVVDVGLASPHGDRYRLPNPQAVQALGKLTIEGAPITVVLDIARRLRDSFDEMLRDVVHGVADQILRDRAVDWIPDASELPDLTARIQQVRPLINSAISSIVNLTLENQVADALGDYIARVLPTLDVRPATT